MPGHAVLFRKHFVFKAIHEPIRSGFFIDQHFETAARPVTADSGALLIYSVYFF